MSAGLSILPVPKGNKEVVVEFELRMGCGLKRGGRFRDILCDSSTGSCGHGCGGRPVD